MKFKKIVAGFALLPLCVTISHAADGAGTLCEKTDKVVFSCPLDTANKIVSICSSVDASGSSAHFRYVYGRLSKPELVFPPAGHPDTDAFANSHLVYGGGTGGTAYSFSNGGYKYIVYSISGTNFDRGGVLIQRAGATAALKEMKCQKGKIVESNDKTLIDTTMRWKPDPDIQAHGLPSVH